MKVVNENQLVDVSEVIRRLESVGEWFGGCSANEQDKLAQAVVKLCIDEVKKIKKEEE